MELLKFCVGVEGCVYFGFMLVNYGKLSVLAWIWGEFWSLRCDFGGGVLGGLFTWREKDEFFLGFNGNVKWV